MRELVAGVIALLLLLVALRLAGTLQFYRRARERTRSEERAMGREVIAEVPTGADLALFSQDRARFYYGEEQIDKDLIRAVRVLVNGQPIASYLSPRFRHRADIVPTGFEDRPEGIARDRWDVAIDTDERTWLVECGAIRERVSQELARKIYEAVREELTNADWRLQD
ncbi:MAG: hypothetical protein HYZ58_01595 [Acidobacteria bacterium]|nr:hypothetical protein [Acidobacteriota bacterium]